MEVLKNPGKAKFMAMVSDCEKEIKLCSPYVKETIIREIIKQKKVNVKLCLITAIVTGNFVASSSDLAALKILKEHNTEIYNHQSLHAKIYIFDDKHLIVTSGNLTEGGLFNNYEYGLLSSDRKLVDTVTRDYKQLLNNPLTGVINETQLNALEDKIKNIKHRPTFDNEDYLLDNKDVEKIIESLNHSWKKDILEIIHKMEQQYFTLKDLYNYETQLSYKHPKNKHIKDKVRQQLQYLRDDGLIKFLMQPGTYKILWSI